VGLSVTNRITFSLSVDQETADDYWYSSRELNGEILRELIVLYVEDEIEIKEGVDLGILNSHQVATLGATISFSISQNIYKDFQLKCRKRKQKMSEVARSLLSLYLKDMLVNFEVLGRDAPPPRGRAKRSNSRTTAISLGRPPCCSFGYLMKDDSGLYCSNCFKTYQVGWNDSAKCLNCGSRNSTLDGHCDDCDDFIDE